MEYSAGDAIQVSVLHAFIGMMAGSTIDAVMPPMREQSCLLTTVLEIFVQVGLNGLTLHSLGQLLSSDDPSYGIPFAFSLFQAQPELAMRMRLVGGLVKDRVRSVAQRTAPHSAAGSPAN
jgi:hypothetical protein